MLVMISLLLLALLWRSGGEVRTDSLPAPSPSPSVPDDDASASVDATLVPQRPTSAPVTSAGPTSARPKASPSSSRPEGGSAGAHTVLDADFAGTGSLTTSTNESSRDWWVESGSGPFVLTGSTLRRTGNTEFDRIFSRKRFGGPGRTVRYRYRARVTKLHDEGGWDGYRGIKTGMKFPTDCTGHGEDDPRSVYGKGPNMPERCSPGSYITVDGIMEDGRYEVARNGYGAAGYDFFYGPKRSYRIGDWVEKTVEIAWIGGNDVRFRFWNNAEGAGKPVWESVDRDSPFMEKGFLWWRLDFADGEWDYFIIEDRGT